MKPTESAAPVSRPRAFAALAGMTPGLPVAVVVCAAALLVFGVFSTVGDGRALFPGSTAGWSLAVLTGIVVGHLVALGRDRWWGGTGSGAALTLAVLLLFGWVPAGLVSLAVVALVGAARRHRWRQGVLHGSVDILGIGAAALVLEVFGVEPSVEAPWTPLEWGIEAAPEVILAATAYLVVTRLLLWYVLAPQGAACPPQPVRPCYGRALSRSPCSASPR